FRKLVHRLTLAAGRSGDLRPFQDGDLSVGLKPGRCVIAGADHDYGGADGVAVTNNADTYLYLDSVGVLQTAASLPDDRSTFLPIALVTAADGAISDLIDLRGEAFLQTPTPRDGIWLGATLDGELSSSLAEQAIEVVPVAGTIDAVILTVGTNIISSIGLDGVEAALKINGSNLCTTKPALRDSDGSGLRSTARGDGTAPVLSSEVASVSAGDLISWALDLTTMGSISQYPRDIGVVLRIMPD
ncbi:MAG: hypothetical protein ACF8NJ_05545, partial [Phycisphaerales bacterium JB038]